MKNKIIIAVIVILIIFSYRIVEDISIHLKNNDLNLRDWYWNLTYVPSNSPPIVDNPLLYIDDDTTIHDIYLVILPTFEDGNEITFEDLNSIEDFMEDKPILNAYLINVDSNGLNIQLNNEQELIPNAKITLRGHSTMESEQKSYKIRLNNESFLGHEVLNLNKHPYDAYRLRNKIAFELFEDIPDITSIRTNLVNLYIKDLTDAGSKDFVNYGLFTNIEHANKKFLKDHNLDTEGYLYKAEEFEFFRYEDEIRDISDPLYEESDFAAVLEPKVAKNHVKIIKMLEDVNNYNLDINKILDKHFNKDNYFTWLAVNILLGNYDTRTQNYFLYSRHDNLAWYFLPWDYDGSMKEDSSLQYDSDGNFTALVGVSNYWNNVLHKRVFEDIDNLNELNEKIDLVYNILTKEKLESTAKKYLNIVEREYDSDPIYRKEVKPEVFNRQIEYISNTTIENRMLYYEHIEKPMPVYLGEIEKIDNGYLFFWGESFDFQGDRLSYTFQVSKDPSFHELVFERIGLRDNELIIDLEPGEYYWRVIIVDSKGNTQRAFDSLRTEDKRLYHGLKHIIIE